MRQKLRKTLVVFAAALLSTSVSKGAVLASTDFNDSTASGNTKSNLNWTLDGLSDPGDMSAFLDGGGAQNLFDGNAFVQDIFIPGINVGNTNSFWTTDISLTVLSGFTVTLTDVTFNAVSVSGGQAENVNRRNDYTAFLIDPSSTQIDEVTVADVRAGNNVIPNKPLVTLDLADTVLSAPGTYTLRIKGGDFTGENETGNHTGLDNLSINGTAVPIPEPSALVLSAVGLAALLRRRRS